MICAFAYALPAWVCPMQMLRSVQAAADRESELMRELAALEDRAVNGSRHELATLNRRFVDETLATKNRHEAELAQLQV